MNRWLISISTTGSIGEKRAGTMLTSVELCAGAGGQALGLEQAGFAHTALVEIDGHCCNTLRHNRPEWNVLEEDMRLFKDRAADYAGMDLLAGGLLQIIAAIRAALSA